MIKIQDISMAENVMEYSYPRYRYCEYHDKGMTSKDLDVGCCWDADRLDLMRVGIYPDKSYLSTKTARLQETIDQCVEQTLNWKYSRLNKQIFNNQEHSLDWIHLLPIESESLQQKKARHIVTGLIILKRNSCFILEIH